MKYLLFLFALLLVGSAPSKGCPFGMVPTGTGTCIDKAEWPAPPRAGSSTSGRPLIGASGLPETDTTDISADTLCRSVGKRVCERREWVSACSRGQKFPYGDTYAPGECNDDKQWKNVDEARVARRDPGELGRLDGSEPPGSHPECESWAGVVDMVGNVEEWVTCPEGEFGWCLVGGYWASQGTRSCESAVKIHSPRWHYYQTGFRCCAEER